ncbi:hypothetical protein RJT34_20297 [Clitoria ternatea]|uniref:Uncharacterized protein n=1 Tax=Clitoria ternatea TaxID=43366 RepID=A0AAN9IT59_CLITE
MAEQGGNESLKPLSLGPYEEAMKALSSLITRRTRADGTNIRDHFNILFDYLKILDLEEHIANIKIIHVAGTKGKVIKQSGLLKAPGLLYKNTPAVVTSLPSEDSVSERRRKLEFLTMQEKLIKVDAMLQNLENEIDDVDAKISDPWRLLDRSAIEMLEGKSGSLPVI